MFTLLCALGCASLACTTGQTSSAPVGQSRTDSAGQQPPGPAPAVLETDLHLTRFGARTNAPVIYLHGGPGSNSYLFEATAASSLGQRYHVLAYDRRGTGRSPDGSQADYSFARALADLHQLVVALPRKPVLLGHSFGGMIALRYLDAHPDLVAAVVLTGAPISFPRTLQTIQATCRARYETLGDAQNLAYMKQLETIPADSPQYVGFTFAHAIGCGLYSPEKPTEAALALYKQAASKDERGLITSSPPGPVLGFIANDSYATQDVSPLVERHKERIFAIYGAEDGIIARADIEFLQATLGADRVHILTGAGHNTFVDQKPAFLAAMDAITPDFESPASSARPRP